MKRLMLLIAASTLWLFLAAVPAFADGGPHIASDNSGATSLTVDSCAGCHRAHTGQAPLLLKVAEEDLCLSCHGAATAGATTDVESGLQYAVDNDDSQVIGALRGGGFVTAKLGDPAMFVYSGTRGPSKNSKVRVDLTNTDPVTSAHLTDMNTITNQLGIAWGNGANGTGAGPAATIGCASCHNPHGNGAYRILNPVPAGTGISAAWTIAIADYGVSAANQYRTVSSHGLLNGDLVTITGGTVPAVAAPGAAVTVVSDTVFTVAGVTTAGTGTGGTVTRVGGVKVLDDTTTDPTTTTRNYTVIQTYAGTTGTPDAGATLTAAEAQAFSPSAGDYFHYSVPWNAGTGPKNNDAPNGIAYATTTGPQIFNKGFNQQITAWCTSCHTRYWAWSEPTVDPGDDPATGPAYANPRPGDSVFTYQHRTRGGSGRACTTCHVSHGSNAQMIGPNSSDYIWPSQVPGSIDVDGAGNSNSRLLKVDNRGTCVLCHDPTGTLVVGQEFPSGASSIPAP